MPGALGPVVYQATVGGVKYSNNPPIVDANLQMAYGQHDMLFLRIEQNRGQMGGNSTTGTWTDGTPISLVYGRAPNNLAPWYGYINHSEVTNNSDSGTNTVQTTYVCTGTSANMNQVRSYNWQNSSPTYVAQQMAQRYGMRAVVTPIGVTFDSEMQNQSDFQFMNYLANKYGLQFRASNGTLYMTSPIIAVNGAAGATPIFMSNKMAGYQDTLRDFELLSGQNLPGSVQANQTVFGIDPDTGLLYSATAQSTTGTSRSNVLHGVSPTSYQDAQAQAAGAAANSQFWVNGTGLVYGYPALYPGKTVAFQGGALPQGYTGQWMVTKATHNLMSSGMNQYLDRYSVSLEVARNNSNGLTLGGTMNLTPEITDCNLSNGVWTTQNPAPIVQVMS